MSNKTISWLIVLLVLVIFVLCIRLVNAENSNLHFTWETVTTNSDGLPCVDLAGYAIYRNRSTNDWEIFTGPERAFVEAKATDTEITLYCPEEGIWYWIIRAYDTSGLYSGISNIVITDIDILGPNSVFHFDKCQKGDINCDGDVDGNDLTEFSKAYGGIK